MIHTRMLTLALVLAVPAAAVGKRADVQDLRLRTENILALQERFARFSTSLPDKRKMGMDRIIAFEEHRHFVYVLGGVRSWMRRVIFLKPGVVVVDDLGKPPAGGPVSWRLHARAGTKIRGRQIDFAGPDAKLRCRSILPGSATVTSTAKAGGGNEKPDHVIAVTPKGKSARGRYLHVFYTNGDAKTLIRAKPASKAGPLRLSVSAGGQTFDLTLPRDPAAAGTIAVSKADGKKLLPERLLPGGILPHGAKGVRLLERWDGVYRGKRRAPWDTGRPSTVLSKAVEGGTIRPGRAIVLGCGTGTNAVYLASKGFDVTALDIAPTALGIGRAKAHKAGVRVRWLLADVLAVPDMKPFDFMFDRGCYHGVRRHDAAGYVKSVRRLSHAGTRVLIVAGNANEARHYGPPRVKESELRGDFSQLFDFQWLRETRLDIMDPKKQGPLAWSVLLHRKAEPKAEK